MRADAQEIKLPLQQVLDVPLTGNATRLDYQSLDAQSGRLYIAHLGDDSESKWRDTRKLSRDHFTPGKFVAPHGATRLFLGFADAWQVTGDPGYYGNNRGQVQLTVTITVE